MKAPAFMKPLYALLASLILFMAGCATAPVIKPMAIDGLEKSNVVTIQDKRPPTEGQKATFSVLVTSEAYAIYRVTETATNPAAVRLLAHRAYEAFPQLADAPTITVHHFVTYANLQSQLRKGAWGAALGGVIGAAIMSQPAPPVGEVLTTEIDPAVFDQTAAKEHRRAFYSKEENPKKASVNVVYIDTEILGRRVATRSLVPPLLKNPNPTLGEVYDLCIANHLALYKTPANPQQPPASPAETPPPSAP